MPESIAKEVAFGRVNHWMRYELGRQIRRDPARSRADTCAGYAIAHCCQGRDGERITHPTVQLPEDIARHLGASHPDLSRAALEAIALEGARLVS